MNRLVAKVTDHEKEISEVEKELGLVRDELRIWVEENQFCPTCGGEIDPDQLLDTVESGVGGHAHG